MSSAWAEAPPEDNAEPLTEGASVEVVAALPLRWRILYFSMASASRSRMREAIGERLDCCAAFIGVRDDCGCGEGILNVLVFDVELAECGRGTAFREGESVDECEEGRLRPGVEKLSTQSPESDVVVVRLVPEPLRMRTLPLYIRGGGSGICATAPHSLPRAAACAKTLRRAFLLFSNCIRTVSCSISRVFVLVEKANIRANLHTETQMNAHEYA